MQHCDKNFVFRSAATPGLIAIVVSLRIFRVLVKSARKLAQQYFLTYQEQIPTAQLVQRVADVMQEYTQQG